MNGIFFFFKYEGQRSTEMLGNFYRFKETKET